MVRQEDIAVPVADGRPVRAHLARPERAEGPVPGLLVLHEILGLNDDIRRIAARFAAEGYVALAPDIFDGRGPKPVCMLRAVADVTRGEGPAVDDMLAARDWLAGRPDVDGGRIGVVGFCMGGSFALLLGSVGDFQVAAPYYGEVAPSADRYRGICPVVAGYGARDRVFAGKGRLLESHLQALGVPHDVKLYGRAGHSYMSQHRSWLMALAPFTPLRARYEEAAAEDSWRRMLAFFRAHLGPTRGASGGGRSSGGAPPAAEEPTDREQLE
jgi:carboxymethylenebutenolidase